MFKYTVIDMIWNETHQVDSYPGEFVSYRHFIGELEAMNELWNGQLKFQETR